MYWNGSGCEALSQGHSDIFGKLHAYHHLIHYIEVTYRVASYIAFYLQSTAQ